MPTCFRCGSELQVNDEGVAPVLCDKCAGKATSRASRGISTGTMRDYPATVTLMAVNIAAYLTGFTGDWLSAWGGNRGPLTLSGEYWRLLTAGFLHAGIWHIGFNMWCLFSLGKLCERLFGRVSTVLIYLLTAVGGNLLSLNYEPARNTVGASGAIFGLAGALLVGIKFGDLMLSEGAKKSLFGSLAFFVGVNFLLGQGGNTDNMCHLGGFISGLIIGLPLASFFSASKTANTIARSVILSVAALLLFAAGRELVKVHGHDARMFAVRGAFINVDLPSAIELLERDTTSGQTSAESFSMLGYAYENTRQPEKALNAYKHALALDPNDEYAQDGLKRVQANDGGGKTPEK
ncbi:MAG TPA: rhomboid family intramembrane serine protease [Candidatus Saccharimonadales bacterium]|jgi:membrane associated rhomboid family serine protease|nr:rhomboid family intramembrane serine protease [Candidatus Saccharimonadales bacterium]